LGVAGPVLGRRGLVVFGVLLGRTERGERSGGAVARLPHDLRLQGRVLPWPGHCVLGGVHRSAMCTLRKHLLAGSPHPVTPWDGLVSSRGFNTWSSCLDLMVGDFASVRGRRWFRARLQSGGDENGYACDASR